MKGDFSRLTFDQTKHYSAVLKQQGRVDLDADWNEQQAINRHRIETEAADVIGCCGAPSRSPGFRITTDGTTLLISKGRIYVDGILCENETDQLDIRNQPDLPAEEKRLVEVFQTSEAASPLGIVYLDVWQRHITALDDPQIRETALGGPDTATRLKTVWQVKVLPVSIHKFDPPDFSRKIGALAAEFRNIAATLEPQVKQQLASIQKTTRKLIATKAAATQWLPTLRDARNLLDNVASLKLPEALSSVVSGIITPIRAQLPAPEPVSCKNPPLEWYNLIAPSTGQLTAHTQTAPPSDDPCCTIPPGAGYQGLENQLYRVEIHRDSNDKQGPTFKWSRDNGSVVTAITGIDINADATTISVHDVGPDSVLGFAVNQWVEVLDDTRELNGLPGDLVQIADMPPNSNQITVKGTLTIGFNNGIYHPKLRRWDSAGEIKTDGTWQPLENGSGIEVQFSNGTYKTGDYWVIPARTSGDIEWPRDTNSQPVAQPPRGIRHHYCRLAIVKRVVGRQQAAVNTQENALRSAAIAEKVVGRLHVVVEDCRCVFPPFCGLPALHITKVSFRDDLGTPVTNGKGFDPRMLADGIAVVCDGPVDPQTITPVTCLVTIDLPYPMFGESLITTEVKSNTTPEVVGFQPLILAADPSLDADGHTILWRPREATAAFLAERLLKILEASAERGILTQGILAHLTLKGNFIRAANASQTYLDGEAFGASDADNVASNLRLPSGDGRRGGDFEMWFWLGRIFKPLRDLVRR